MSRFNLDIRISDYMDRKFNFAPDEYYHLYQRGVEKRKIFLDHGDYWRFLALLYLANADPVLHLSDFTSGDKKAIFSKPRSKLLVAIGAYCLMPNHFHLLVRATNNDGISKFMQKLITGYTMYFNKRYGRTGALFGGTFKAEHADDDVYLRYLYAYIHLNPVKISDPEAWAGKRIDDPQEAKKFLSSYRYSSYQFYNHGNGGSRIEDGILSPSLFPEYFSEERDFADFINDWMFAYDPTVKV